jgi:hypothetical protein
LQSGPRLEVLDFTQPEHPILVGSIDLSDDVSLLSVSEGRAYVRSVYGDIDLIDVREPSAPVRLGTMLILLVDKPSIGEMKSISSRLPLSRLLK